MSEQKPARRLTIREAAELARVHRATVYRWIQAGQLPTVRTPGGQQRIDPALLFRASDEASA